MRKTKGEMHLNAKEELRGANEHWVLKLTKERPRTKRKKEMKRGTGNKSERR
jgi:hypothetical protein